MYMGMATVVIKLVLLLPVLAFASHAFLDQPHYSGVAIVPPGDALQDYLCGNGSLLHSNMTLALEGGEHRIPSGPFCFVSNVGNVLITGSPQVATTIHCQGERGFGFIQVRNITIEHVSIVGCGHEDKRISETQGQTVAVVFYLERSLTIILHNVTLARFRGIGVYGYDLHKASMSEVVFDGCAINTSCSAGLFEVSRCDTDQLQQQDTMLTVQSCTYHSLFGNAKFSAGVSLRCIHVRIRGCVFEDLKGTSINAIQVNVSVENTTFVRNLAKDIIIENSNTNISRCRFKGHQNEEAILITSTRSVTTLIAESMFQNYSIGVLDIRTGTGFTRVTNCTFEDNGASTIKLLQKGRQPPMAPSQDGGPVVCAEVSKYWFTRNRPGAVSVYTNGNSSNILNCSNVINDSTFFQNSASNTTNEGIVNFHIDITSDINRISSSTHLMDAYVSRCLFEMNKGQSISILIESDKEKVPVSFVVADCSFLHGNLVDGSKSRGVAINVAEHLRENDQILQVESIAVRGCTFHRNTGSAVLLDSVTGNVDFENCTFTENNAEYGAGLVITFSNILQIHQSFPSNDPFCNVSVSRCLFEMNRGRSILIETVKDKVPLALEVTGCSFLHNILNDSLNYSGVTISVVPQYLVYAFVHAEFIVVTGCTFHGNSGSIIVLLQSVTGKVEFKNCTFTKNNAHDAGLKIDLLIGDKDSDNYLFYNISVLKCVFEMNRGRSILMQSGYNKDILPVLFMVTECSFLHNALNEYEIDTYNYGVLVINGNEQVQSIVVSGCTFRGNTGSAVQLNGVTGNVEYKRCNFTENNAKFGAGLAIVHQAFSQKRLVCTVTVRKSIFINNNAVMGAAIYYVNKDYSISDQITLIDVVIKGSHCSPRDNYTRMLGGAVYIERTNLIIVGKRGSEFTSNGPQGAVQGSNTLVTLKGTVTFANNTGENGGAISLLNYGRIALMYCHENTCGMDGHVNFSGNRATTFGGAIYVGGKMDIYSDNNEQCAIIAPVFLIASFRSNYAQLAGHAVYASPIYQCSNYYPIQHSIRENFIITPVTGTSNDSQVVSFPAYVTICCEGHLCDFTNRFQISTFPGRTVRIYVSLVDYGKNPSPGVVVTQIEGSGLTTDSYENVRLGDNQNAQWVKKKCSLLEYQIYGPENATFNLILSSYSAYVPTLIKVNLMQCVPWFTLITDPYGLKKCDCLPFWASSGLVCDTVNGTVARKGTNWIGLYEDKAQPIPAFVTTCPLNYCKSNFTHISLQSPEDNVCDGGRSGILCGHCLGNYSIVFGSSGCHVCSNMWLVTILMYMILGAFLVILLFILNLTVTQGTLYGFIFYANIIQVNTSIFFNDSVLVPLQVMISFINLDLGFSLCFYDGMDDAAKTGLQFVFPAYLLALTITVIVVCHYFLSHQSPSRHCLAKLSCLVGQRATGVLSSLIYLSYSKLLRTVVDVFSYSTLQIPNGSILIWYYDGNIPYLQGKHLVLFVIAMVISLLFLIPYAFVLTFIPIIEHFSEHNGIFRCLYKMVNRMKPMNDAHYAPYKGEWRWWLGVRLWFLIFMYILNPVYSSDNPSLLLLIHGTTMIGFISVQGFFQPFGVQMSTNGNRSIRVLNGFYNWLDLFSLINYAVLALSALYILDHNTGRTQLNIAIGLLVGLFCLVFLSVVLFHVIVAFLKVCNMHDAVKEKLVNCINHVSLNEHNFTAAIELERPTDIDVMNTDDCAAREP